MWNIFRQSIRTQLLFLLCVAMLPLLALLFFQNHRESADARSDAFARVRLVAEQTAQRLNQYLVDHEGVLARIAARPGVRALDGQACDPLIHEFVRLFPEYTNLAVQDLQGGNDCSFLERKFTPEMLERVPGYLQAHAADGMTVGGAVWGPVSGRWVASLFYPVRDAQNRTAGLMRLPMDLRVLSERLLPLVPAGTLVVVADAQGRILMRSRDPQDWMGRPVSDAMRALAENPGRGAWAAVPGVDGVERLYAVAAVPRAHWTVYTGVRADEVFAPSHASFARGLALAAGFACLALLLAWRIAQRIVRPIDALHQTTSQVAAGQAQARVAIDGGARELQAVAAEFNRMLDSRERALQELADSESRFRTLSDLSSDWYWEQDAQHRIVRLDGRVAEGTGLPEQVYLGKTRWEVPALNLTEQDWAAHRAVLQARQPFRNFIIQRRDAQGAIRWGVVSGAPVFDDRGQFCGYRGVGRDMTQAKRQEQDRLGLALHIEELSRRLVHTQEEIRRRFSRELHDRTSPNLAALRISLDMLSRTAPAEGGTAETGERLEDMRALIEDTTQSVREICAELHPSVLDRGGLLAVVRSYASQFARRTGMQVHVCCAHGEVRLAPERELALFRIVQEAMTNSAKHAQARTITVQMQLLVAPLTLCASDDGLGFDVEQAMRERRTGGLGLINMRETAEFAGGRLSLHSAPGAGTRICVEISPACA